MSHGDEKKFECAVIGAGPAGLTAALYLGRFHRSTILFGEGKPRAAWIPRTHNLLGYHRGISGAALLRQMGKQVRALGLPFVSERATVARKSGIFEIKAGSTVYLAKKVILATGIEDLQPKIPNLAELRKSGLLRYCPICDGFEHSGLNICVLVKDEECARQALFIHHYSRHLTVILPQRAKLRPHRRRQLRKIGVAVVKGDVKRIEANKRANGIYVELAGGKCLPFDAAYVELGFRVRDEAFRGLRGLARTRAGLLRTTGEQRTSVTGLFAVGDCVNRLAQISVAAGQAAVAATAVHNDLLDEEE